MQLLMPYICVSPTQQWWGIYPLHWLKGTSLNIWGSLDVFDWVFEIVRHVLEINVYAPVMTELMLLYAFLWITSTNRNVPGLFAFFPPRYSYFLGFFLWIFLEVGVHTGNFLTNSGGMNMHIIYLNLLTTFQNNLNVLFHFAFVTIKGTHFPKLVFCKLLSLSAYSSSPVHWWTSTTSAACMGSFCDEIISVKQVQPVSTSCKGLTPAGNSAPRSCLLTALPRVGWE